MSHLRRILALCLILITTHIAHAQNVLLTESFEHAGAQPPGWTSTNVTSIASHNWFANSSFQTDTLYCDSVTRFPSDTITLTSAPFNTIGMTFITLEFDHICDISPFDTGRVEVLTPTGWQNVSNWLNYEGDSAVNGGAFFGTNFTSKGFNQTTYPALWPFAPTTNALWKPEILNISAAANMTSSRIRFVLEGSSGGGVPTASGWFLDKINVIGDSCETVPPSGFQTAPFIPNNSIQFSGGPYKLKAEFTDKHTGVDSAFILFKVNNGPWDSIGMFRPGGSASVKWEGSIPKFYNPTNPLDSFMPGDSVKYIIKAYDKSIPCRNSLSIPKFVVGSDSCFKFFVSSGETLPFCDNFDVNNFWTDSTTGNPTLHVWERGDPTAGGGFAANSTPFAWVTNLAGAYPMSTEAFLYSPIFDFGAAITPRLTFWQNRNMATDGDGLSLQYSINNDPWVTLGFNDDVNGVNLNTPNCPSTWYSATGTGSDPDSWNGTSNGWVQSFYQLPDTFNGAGSVQFRFRMNTDANNNAYGVAIDDFCLENPPQFDISSLQVIAPGNFNDAPFHFVRSAGDMDSVIVVYRNIGTDTLFSIPARYLVDSVGGTHVQNETFTYPRTWNGVTKNYLAPLQADTFLFTNRYRVPNGPYLVRTVQTLGADADADNDTAASYGHYGFITSDISWQTDFDAPGDLWATTPLPISECGNPPALSGTRWEKGTPNYGATNSARSPNNAWDVNLTTAYNTDAEEYLYTQFFDLSGWDQSFISFWQNRNTDAANDGFRLEYNIDPNVDGWTDVQSGNAGGGKEVNWFSDSPLSSSGRDGWSANSSGWIYSEFPLDSLLVPLPASPAPNLTQVQFRFVFTSDGTFNTTEDGVSIDDFRVVNPPLFDVEVVEYVRPVRGCVMDLREPVEVIVKNVGKEEIDSIPVTYRFSRAGAPGVFTTATDTIFDTLAVGESISYTFMNDSADMLIFDTYFFDAWVAQWSDTNQVNDSIFGHEAENVEGCNVEVELTTGTFIPLGSKLYMIDTTNLPHDTIYEESFSAIGPNAIQYSFEICMENVGDYKFVITPAAGNFISFWNLQDLFADTSIGTGTAATGPNGYGFAWQCPPLLSASSERIRVFGASSSLPIPQDYTVRGTFKNRGSYNIRNVEINLSIERVFPTGSPYTLNYKDTLIIPSPGMPTLAEVIEFFDTTWSAEPGEYDIFIWTKLPNGNPDLATFDDTTYLNFVVLDTTSLPYCNNFENNQNPWGSFSKNNYDTNSVFERGTPNQAVLNSTSSPPNAWMTGLSSDYVVLDSSGVYTPLFLITDTSLCYQISFDHEFLTEKSFDGGVVECSVDSGVTWHVVGSIGDTLYPLSTTEWYNTPYIVGLEGSPQPPGWSGNSQGLISSSYDLKLNQFGLTTFRVGFRFRFGADASINDEGWLIDEFCFEQKGLCDYSSCTDGKQNQGETGIDCGGPCAPCESCNDGIQNQNETGVDCGGVCAPCPSCVDNVLNGDEEKPDCGGALCEPCATCNDGIRNWHWVNVAGVWERQRETGVDCGGPCPNSCWVGVEDLNANEFGLAQNLPNPTDGRTVIHYSIPQTGEVNIIVRNMLGQTMFQRTVEATQGLNQIEIDVNDWADGVYYYSFEFKDERLVRKMTVSK